MVFPRPDDLAYLVYTSGTTGPAKGAMIRHRNVLHNAIVYQEACRLDRSDVVLGVAPLSRITGIVAHQAIAFHLGIPMVMFARFDVQETLRLIEKHRVTFTVASITVYIAMLNHPQLKRFDLSRFKKAMEDPVDKHTGALSVGLVTPGHEAWIVDLENPDIEMPIGEEGELVVCGPGITDGYWEKPEETAYAIKNGRFFTGDVAQMDARGWCYIVDRKKDLINIIYCLRRFLSFCNLSCLNKSSIHSRNKGTSCSGSLCESLDIFFSASASASAKSFRAGASLSRCRYISAAFPQWPCEAYTFAIVSV